MNFLIIVLVVFIAWRVHKQRKPRNCAYYSHERTHSDTLVNMVGREVRELRKELKDAGVIP